MSSKQDAFATVGFNDYEHALERFKSHENSNLHVRCMELHELSISRQQSMQSLLNKQAMKDQENNRKHLINIMLSIQYLHKQNIALQGLTKEKGNFYQLVKLIEKIKPSGKSLKADDCLSHQMQNEIIQCFADTVREVILSEIRRNAFFGMSGDETCDRNNQSIFAIVCRTANHLLEVKELFAGICVVKNKKADTLVETVMVTCVLDYSCMHSL